MLIAADRVDVLESRIAGLAQLRPDNPITQSGILAEKHYHGIRSRTGEGRYDVRHHPIDYALMAAPYALLGFAAYKFTQQMAGRRNGARERMLIAG